MLDWPRVRYPSPTSCRASSPRKTRGTASKSRRLSSTRISSTSPIDLPLNLTSSVCRLNRLPPQTSHVTCRSGRKCIGSCRWPRPRQASQRPPLALKLNRPAAEAADLGLAGQCEHPAHLVKHARSPWPASTAGRGRSGSDRPRRADRLPRAQKCPPSRDRGHAAWSMKKAPDDRERARR